MLNIPPNQLPLAAQIRLQPDNQGRHLVLIKPCAKREAHAGIARMQVDADGILPECLAAVNRALLADFVVTLACPDEDTACDVYLDACSFRAAARAAARAAVPA